MLTVPSSPGGPSAQVLAGMHFPIIISSFSSEANKDSAHANTTQWVKNFLKILIGG